MNKNWMIVAVACAMFAGLATTTWADEKAEQAALQAKAKVSKADAEKTAMAKVPNGTVKEADLEEENGKLLWSFDMTTPGSKDITEVEIDAITGAFVKMDKETPEDQQKEKDEDKAKEGKK